MEYMFDIFEGKMNKSFHKAPSSEVVIVNGKNSEDFSKYAEEIKSIEDTGYYLNIDDLNVQNIFSPIDRQNKYSKRFCDCTGVVLFGQDKNTGETVSCISHANLELFYPNLPATLKKTLWKDSKINGLNASIETMRKELLETSPDEQIERPAWWSEDGDDTEWVLKADDLREKISEAESALLMEDHPTSAFLAFDKESNAVLTKFKNTIAPNTVSGNIIGGQIITKDLRNDTEDREFDEKELYSFSLNMWKDKIEEHFNLDLPIAHAPLNVLADKHGTDVYVDNNLKKTLIVFRTEQDSFQD